MPLLVDDLKDNKLYRKKIFLPSDPKNKRKHAAIFLMTPDYVSSVKTMNSPFFINNGRYESYYIEKDISFILSEDHRLLENPDDIYVHEVSIPQCTRITCTTVQELDKYGIPHGEDLVAFTAYVFIDYNNIMCGYIIMTEYNTRIYDVEAISYKMKRDLIEFAILLFNPKTVKTNTPEDKKLYVKYGFKDLKCTDDKLSIMIKEDGILTESLASAKIDVEIALWTSQIKITEMIIKNFGNDNWMSHMYKNVKSKIVKIPLKDYAETTEDTIDRWRNKLKDQKATLDFYLAIKEIDAKDMFDISDIMQEYVDWVDSLSCPKTLKLKIINEVIDSYKKSIKEYEYNLKRYRALNDAQKRVENVTALASKIFSVFSWVNATPIGIIRGKLVSAILPKSQKKAVLSEIELEAKIELYTKIVETLEEKKKEVEALDEAAFIGLVNEISMMYDIPFTIVTETKKYKKSAGESKDLAKARQFVTDVKYLANEYKLPVFVVTNGASGYSNNGCEAVKYARDSHIEWEKKHGADPYEDWSDRLYNESVLLESPIPPKSADKKGAYCAFPSEKWDCKTMDEDCTDITIEHAINNFLQTKYPDHEDKSTCCIFVLDTNNILHFIGQARIESTDPIRYSWIRKVRTPKGFTMYESSLLEAKSVDDTIKNIDGYISHKQMRDNIYLVRRKRHYSDDGKDHTENWLYILTDDNKIAAEMLLYNKNTEMYSLETKKKYRNHGYATQLINCAVNDLGARLLSIKMSDENGPAHKLYTKLGFKEYNRGKDYIYLKVNGRISENAILSEAGKSSYSPPYTRKEILDTYGKDIYDRLMKDPAHVFRADTGIELIHKEPSLEELKRIKRNWDMMTDSNKKKSDNMSIKLFGKTNEEHYTELLSLYESAQLSRPVILSEAGKPRVPMDIRAFNKRLNAWNYGVLYSDEIFDASNFDFSLYRTMTIKEMDKYKVGVCWDFTHYEAVWFDKHAYKFETYYIEVQDEDNDIPNHTFLVFYDNGKVYYFESSWAKYQGIEEFNNIYELLRTVTKRHESMYATKGNKCKIWKYDAVSSSLEKKTTNQFMKAAKQKEIKTSWTESTLLENSLSNYERIELNSANVKKYKDQAKYLSHFRTEKDGNYKGYIWLEHQRTMAVVAACCVDCDRGYIQAIEISEPFKGKGLSYDILDACIKLGGTKLTVTSSNSVAKHVYTKRGFKTISSSNGREEMQLSENSLLEEKLSSKDRKDLPDSAFGIPSERRYPMPDKSHVLSAIRMFNHVEAENEKTLAHNIKKKIREFAMEDEVNVSSDNRFSKYYKAKVHEGYIAPYIEEDAVLTALALQTENSITFLEGNDEVLVEADAAYNTVLRRILYSERIKNHKEIMLLYDQVKEDCPFIKYAFVNYDRYAGRNLFIDWSYYTKAFFKNNVRKYDKAVDLYFEFINRFLDDKRLEPLGYGKKTIIVPVDDWIPEKDKEYWNYKEHLNPISIIYRLVFRDLEKLQSVWGDRTFIFTGRNGYFKMNFAKFEKKNLPRFLQNIKILVGNLPISDDTDEPDNSTAGIVNMVIDKIEANSDIRINNLTGATKASEEEIKDRIDNAAASSEDKTPEEKLVDAIATTAKTSKDDEEVIQKMDNDEYIKQLVVDLRNSSVDSVSIEPTRAARMRKLNDQFAKKSINGKTVSQILTDTNDKPLPEVAIPIDSINDDWKHMKFVNHSKEYDLSADIIRCINHFADTTVPVSVIDFSVEDTSTSEDWVETWTVKCEDSYGKRFTLKFDIPKLKNDRSMKLRGNDKIINGQLMNLPIIKTERNTCQMTSNYNKIFFSGYGTSTGKSYVVADRIIKTLNKMGPNSDIKVDLGDNSRICAKYELPMDYIDIASVVSKITYFNRHIKVRYTLFFNQDELREKYGKLITDKDALPIGIMESDSFKGVKILYAKADVPVSFLIYETLFPNEKFAEVYATTNTSVRYTYSKASILNTDIPVAVIIGYYIGLIPMLDRAGVKYEVSDKRPKYDKNVQDIIRLSDAYIVYDLDYDSSMLLNGLKECDLAAYSLKEVNSKKMWVEFLDNFGGRLKADGLDMFYDLMLDPITKIVCDKYDLPTNFIDALLYANMLMSDNKFNKHVDIKGNRYRTTEIIAGYTYKALCNSYTQYRRDVRSGRDARMTMKQSAVIDLLFADNTFGDLSSLSDLLEYESLSSTSFKGLSGMNSDRAYGLDKRTFDESMVNVLALSTGFAPNAGINRQATIDMNIDSTRGYIKNNNPNEMSVTKTFCMTEALTPFGATSDDPFRSAMTFIQTSKHEMRTKVSDPLLVTNGSDEALPYLTSNTFTYKTKDSGKVKELTDEYMIIEYKDGSTEVIDLRERILKNSDGGMYIALKLDTDLKVGNVFSGNEIVAYDKASYTPGVGPSKSFAYDIGTFVKFAVINSDEGFEDSCVETEWISEAMASTVVINKEYTLPKDTNVYFIAKKGQAIQEGDPLLIFQNSFDEEDANMLIKSLSSDEDDDVVAELGRIPIYSKVTGVVKDIKILRTVEIDELSPSLKKIVTDYEKDVKKFNKVLEKYDPEKAKIADATYKLEPTGKLKNATDSVRIEFSLAYEDKFSVGDKTVCYSALKGVSKGKIPKGLEPYSQYRQDEKIHYIQSTTGDMKRMVGSILKIGAINKVMVELARQSCDIMGIKWKYFDEY